MLDISIVITTFNSEKFIKSCLNSIFAQDYRNLEIIVVDNGSVDSTEIFVKKYRPKIKFLKNIKNRGASYARNQGIDISCAEYVMCMDSDTYLEKNFLHHLKKVLSNIPPRVCAISPKILKEDSNKIFSCGISISSIYRAYDVGCDKTDKEFNDSFLIDGPSSCCGIFRRESLERIKDKNGYFDENFFFLFEDADLALRLKKRGCMSLFIPQLLCYHRGNSSSTPQDLRRYLCFRNRIYMILKNNSFKKLPYIFLKSLFYDFFRSLHFSLTNKYALSAFGDIANFVKSHYKNGKPHKQKTS